MTTARRWVATDFGGPEALSETAVTLTPPGEGEVAVAVRAVGMNPADYKHFGPGQDKALLPLTVGYEVSGILTGLGPDTEIASGGGAVGDEVVAFQLNAGYSTALTIPAEDVFAKPDRLSFAEAANLLLVGTTAAELLAVTRVAAGDTVVVHAASGAVGSSVVQQARLIGARVIGTTGDAGSDLVASFGATPVAYGPGLEDRVRELAPTGVTVALDTVGSDEAVEVSLALVADRQRIATTAAFARAAADGFAAVGTAATSASYRRDARSRILGLAADGRLRVPMAQTFPFGAARAAVAVLMGAHTPGKLALLVD